MYYSHSIFKKLTSILAVIFLVSVSITPQAFILAQGAEDLIVKDQFLLEAQEQNELSNKIKDGKINPDIPTEDEPTKFKPWGDPLSDEEILELGYIPGEILVKFEDDVIDISTISGRISAQSFVDSISPQAATFVLNELEGKGEIALNSVTNEKIEVLQENFLQVDEYLQSANISVLRLGILDSVDETVAFLKSTPGIEYAEPNYIYFAASVPNDPRYNDQWSLHDLGTSNKHINMEQAWDIETGSKDVIVAVLDSGVDYNHSDLDGNNGNMWNGTNCKDKDNIVIDAGCPFHGWDFVNDDNDPMDDRILKRGHGTRVAGIIGAEGNNGEGIAGINWEVSIMAVKVLNASGQMRPFGGDSISIINGVNFAKK